MNTETSENESEFECLIRSSNFGTSFNILRIAAAKGAISVTSPAYATTPTNFQWNNQY